MTVPALDSTLGFTIPTRHARGRITRLGATLEAILAPHALPPAIAHLLTEGLVLAALFGTTLKDDAGQLTLQAQTQDGAVDLMVCDYRGGEMRGYVRHDAERAAALGPPASPSEANPYQGASLAELLGHGYLAITFDQATTGERYQGIVPLEGGSLAAAAENYFAQSEQIPSLVRIGIATGADGKTIAGGLLIQHLPEGEEGRDRIHTRLDHPEWDHVAALGQTVSTAELADPSLSFEGLVWRLFNEEEVRIFPAARLSRGCRCDPVYVESVISRFPADERRSMADEEGLVHVDCEFCAKRFSFAA